MRWTSRKEVDSNEKIITNVKRASVFYPNSRRRVRSLLKIKKKKIKQEREREKEAAQTVRVKPQRKQKMAGGAN